MANTFPEGAFRHIIDYPASVYSYLWVRVYAQDLFSVFKKGGLLNRQLGIKYINSVLVKGSSEDPMILLKDFLGRKPNNRAFLKTIGSQN